MTIDELALDPKIPPSYWTLKEAIDLIRSLAPTATKIGFQPTLGGDVLLGGSSQEALQLYFLPMKANATDKNLLKWLESVWGKYTDPAKWGKYLKSYSYSGKSPYTPYRFLYSGLPIEVNVVGKVTVESKVEAKIEFRHVDLAPDAATITFDTLASTMRILTDEQGVVVAEGPVPQAPNDPF